MNIMKHILSYYLCESNVLHSLGSIALQFVLQMVPSKWFRSKHIKIPNNLVFQMSRCSLSASRYDRHGERRGQRTRIPAAAGRLTSGLLTSGRLTSGLLTSGLAQGTGLSAQPLEQRPHHLGTAEALEARTHVHVVPLQRADPENPAKTSGR